MKFIPDFKRISAPNLETHKSKLEEQIKIVQIFYADYIYNNQNKEKKSFYFILDEINSGITDKIKEIVSTEKECSINSLYRENRDYLQPYIDAINEIHQSHILNHHDNDYERRLLGAQSIVDYVRELSKESKNKYPDVWAKQKEKRESPESRNKEAGLIHFKVLNAENHSGLVDDLEKFGFHEYDEFIDIHFPDMYQHSQKVNKELLHKIKDSFEKLAVQIVEDYPFIQAVVAFSWLMDHPVVQRILPGFIVTDRVAHINWRQFINEDGQIDQGRLKYLSEHGEPEFKNRLAYIKIVDFLQEYLPESKRGNLVLKEANPDWLDKYNNLEGFNIQLRKLVVALEDGKIQSLDDVDGFFAENTLVFNTLKFLNIYEDLIDLIKDVLAKGYNVKDIRNLSEYKPILQKIDIILRDYRQNILNDSNKYIDNSTEIN